MAEETPTAPEPPPARSRWGWDFSLMTATVAIFVALGVQSLAGTLYTWWAIRTIEGWQTGPGYASFVAVMNAIAAPLVAALVVVMGLCVPKRLFARGPLVLVSAGMVALGAAVWLATRSLADGLAAYLVASAFIQVGVVVMTYANAGSLAYLTEGRLAKVGSGLLHLGFIVFALVVVALQTSPWMAPVFYTSLACLLVGSALSFYARPGSRKPRAPSRAR